MTFRAAGQEEAAALYALACALHGDDPDDSADLYATFQTRGNLFAFADGEALLGGAVLFFDNAELYLHSVFAPTDLLFALLEAIERRFANARRLITDVAIEDDVKGLVLTAKGFIETGRDHEYRFFEKRPSDPASVLHVRNLNLRSHDGKRVRLILTDGTQVAGVCEWLSEGFCDSELGISEEALQIGDTVYAVSDIACLESDEAQ